MRDISRECLRSRDTLLWEGAIRGLWSVIAGKIVTSRDDKHAAMIDTAKRTEYYLDADVLESALFLISPGSGTDDFTRLNAAVLISWLYHSGLLSDHQKNSADQRGSVVVDKEEYTCIADEHEYITTDKGVVKVSSKAERTGYRDVTLAEYLEGDPPWQFPQ